MKKVEGFTLIEVMVALALLVIVGTVLMGLFSQTLRNSRKTTDYTQAILLAGSEMEKAISQAVEPGTETDSFEKYEISREIRALKGLSGEMKLYEVIVKVSWGSSHYELRTIKLQGEKETGEE